MGTPAVAPVKHKLNVVYLKGKGYAHQEIADGVWVDEDTVTEKVRKLSLLQNSPCKEIFHCCGRKLGAQAAISGMIRLPRPTS